MGDRCVGKLGQNGAESRLIVHFKLLLLFCFLKLCKFLETGKKRTLKLDLSLVVVCVRGTCKTTGSVAYGYT